MRALVSSLTLSLSMLLLGCASSPGLRAAEAGQWNGLSKEVAAAVKAGKLEAADATKLAWATARGEALRAQGDGGADTLRDLEACARHVDGPLEARQESGDELGALAAMIRLEAGLESARAMASRAQSVSAAWRAVGARALVGEEDGAARRARMLDQDQDVRLAALRAAATARDPADVEALLEAARVDPYPLARTAAIRAAGEIGGARVVVALKDLWPRADEGDKIAIAEAWATEPSIDAGGRDELQAVLAKERGTSAIEAAFALVRTRRATGNDDAVGVLERAIQEGATKERLHALLVAPLANDLLRDAIVKAQDDKDEVIAIFAIARRLEVTPEQRGAPDKERAALAQKLLGWAASDQPFAREAKRALARGRVREVLPLLERDVESKDLRARETAGLALASLGDLPHAAIAAVDVDPRVRVRVACAILNARR